MIVPSNLLDLREGGCAPDMYGDHYDPMGIATGHYHAYNKEVLGAISPAQVARATQSGTFVLEPLEVVGTGLKQLRIPLEINGFFYFLEYRRPLGHDSQVSAPVDGVQVRLFKGDSGEADAATLLLRTLIDPAHPFVDPYRNIRVDVTAKTDDHITLQVTRP